MIEHAVLSSIRSNGLAIGAEIGNSMELRHLEQPPIFDPAVKNKPVLYRPNKFKFKAIDGMIVLITHEKENARENTNKNAKNTKKNAKKYAKEQKPKLFMYPLRITLASSHSDSHAKFFEEYNKWARELSTFDVAVQVPLITQGRWESRQPRACSKWPRPIQRDISLQPVSDTIFRKYQTAQGPTCRSTG